MKTAALTVSLLACAITVSTAKPRLTEEQRAARRQAAVEKTPEQQAAEEAAQTIRELSTLPGTVPEPPPAPATPREARQERRAQQEAAVRQEAINRHLQSSTAQEFEEKNSNLDLLRGKLTYATRQPDGSYTAYLHIRWGDLDQQIPLISSTFYSNWDGSVKLQQGGQVTVVKEYAFDDRDGTTGGVDGHDGLGRDSGKKPAKPGEPGAGSGRDALIKDNNNAIVAWKSGVVGATDGLCLLLDLRQPDTRGTLQLGNFTIPFVTQER